MTTQNLVHEGYDVDVKLGSGVYVLSGWDTNGPFANTNNKTINMAANSIIKFKLQNITGHPFWIKTSNSTGTANAVTGSTVFANTGKTSGYILFAPTTAGTYYYNCEYHSSMAGQIIVAS